MIYYIIQHEGYNEGSWFETGDRFIYRDFEACLFRINELRRVTPDTKYRAVKVTKEVLDEV